MSGHSHFSTIKHKKEAEDKRKGKIFSKMSRLISVAAREKGGDPETNPKLRMAIERAKEYNMPKDNIKRAIKRGTGELEGVELEEVIYEAYGPAGIAIIIEGITDNKNRTLDEIKQILSKHQGKLAREGSVKWLFERKGVVLINLKSQSEKLSDKESLDLAAIEAGADDLYWCNGFQEVYTSLKDLEKVKQSLKKEGVSLKEAALEWVPKNRKKVNEKEKKKCEELFEELDDNDSVQEIYSNLE